MPVIAIILSLMVVIVIQEVWAVCTTTVTGMATNARVSVRGAILRDNAHRQRGAGTLFDGSATAGATGGDSGVHEQRRQRQRKQQ